MNNFFVKIIIATLLFQIPLLADSISPFYIKEIKIATGADKSQSVVLGWEDYSTFDSSIIGFKLLGKTNLNDKGWIDLNTNVTGLNARDIAGVEYAILETDGELSVLLKGPQQTVTYQALSLPSPAAMPPYMLIQDGAVNHAALRKSGFNENWLNKQLRAGGCGAAKDVFFAMLMSDGALHLQTKYAAGGNVKFIDTGIGEGWNG